MLSQDHVDAIARPPIQVPPTARSMAMDDLFEPAPRVVPVSNRVKCYKPFPGNLSLFLMLLFITAVGAFLRFWRIDYQSLWVDEWSTIERIKNNFDDILQRLNGQGFPPGWYVALWYYTRWVTAFTGSKLLAFSTTYLRYFPALFGTLTVPAMYLLARGFTDRRGALLATLFAAVNPFLIYYSRDLKMYAACYFFVTLTMALFLRWQQTRRHWLWWPLFTLSGACMLAVHASAWFMIPIQLIWLLTRPRVKGFDLPLWVLSIGLISLLPLWWYLYGTDWVTRVAAGEGGGITWNSEYNSMSVITVLSLPAIHLFGFLTPRLPPDWHIHDWFRLGDMYEAHVATRTLPGLAKMQMWVLLIIGALFVLGLWPWRSWKTRWVTPTLTRGRAWWLLVWCVIPMGALALTWIPSDSPWHKTVFGEKTIVSIWEPRYLGICCPAFILMATMLLRRLPGWPLRALAILGVVVTCTVSSLSNHLSYRQMPWERVTAAIMPHVDRKQPAAVQVLVPSTRNSEGGDTASFLYAIGEFPDDWGKSDLRSKYVRWRGDYDPDSSDRAEQFMKNAGKNAKTKTIVLVDFNGDLTTGAWSSESLGKLAPGFSLQSTDNCRWQLEWRYYLFRNVRIRVWERSAASGKGTPTTIPATKAK